MADRIYLTMDDVMWIHSEQLSEYGEAAGVRDAGLVGSALLRPQTGYYADLIEEASALWESLAMNHGFVDGNKRVGFACTVIFLQANGLEPTGSEQEWIDFIYSNLDNGTFYKDRLEAWLREHTAGPSEPPAVNS